MKQVLDNFNDINQQTKKLVYYASNKFTISKKDICIDGDDIYQNAQIELWKICNNYKSRDKKEILKIFKKYLWSSVAGYYRKVNLKKNKGTLVSIDAQISEDKASKSDMEGQFFLNKKQVDEYCDMKYKFNLSNELNKKDFLDYLNLNEQNPMSITVYNELAFPSQEFISFCNSYSKQRKTRERTSISLAVTAEYFNMSVGKLYGIIKTLTAQYKNYLNKENS